MLWEQQVKEEACNAGRCAFSCLLLRGSSKSLIEKPAAKRKPDNDSDHYNFYSSLKSWRVERIKAWSSTA